MARTRLILLVFCFLGVAAKQENHPSLRATSASSRRLGGVEAAENGELRPDNEKEEEEQIILLGEEEVTTGETADAGANEEADDIETFEEETEKAKKRWEAERLRTSEADSQEVTEDQVTRESPLVAKILPSNLTKNLNATAITLSACEQIEMAVSFLTSLDFDQDFWTLLNYTSSGSSSGKRAIWEVYFLQIILTPLSVLMALFGSNLLHPTCCLAAAGVGVFLVFQLVDFMAKSKSLFLQSLTQTIDCQMKLAISVVSASVSIMLASAFLRFGLFSLGAIAAGGVSYLIFDAFPFLDPTRQTISYDDDVTLHGQLDSELSHFAWIITTLVGVCGGIFLRWYEQASLEVLTAAMGGMGFAYSLHTLVIIQGASLNRSLVFLIANFVAFGGWRFQRHRRLQSEYAHKKNHDEQSPLVQQPPSMPATEREMPETSPPEAQNSEASWDQLQSSVRGLLRRKEPANTQQAPPSQEQIAELTKSLNTLIARMEKPDTEDK